MILVTGGAGFIGSNFILQWISERKSSVVNLDKLTSTGNLNNLSLLEHHASHHFIRGDICNRSLVQDLLKKYQPIYIIHCAAETQADRSTYHPEKFILKNVVGTYDLLEETLAYWRTLSPENQQRFRFLNVSSHEVFGHASTSSTSVTENSPYLPNNPYAASKASADHWVRAYHQTFGLPTLIANSPINFGPYQFPEKLIPSIIINALQGKPLNVYAEDNNTLPWLYVGDQCHALQVILERGTPGEAYNIGAQAIVTRKKLIEQVCSILDDLDEDSHLKPHASLIKITKEPARHDQRHVINDTKLRQLGWEPKGSFESNLRKTVHWYLNNMTWMENVISGEYKDWIVSGAVK